MRTDVPEDCGGGIIAALKRRKGTVRSAGGPQHRGPRHGGTQPILLVTYSFARLQGRGCGQTQASPGGHIAASPGAGVPRLGRGSPGPAAALPPLQAQPSPTSTHLPSNALSLAVVCPATLPRCTWGDGPPSTPGRAALPGPLGGATSQPSAGTFLLVSSTVRKAEKALPLPAFPGEAQSWGPASGDHHSAHFSPPLGRPLCTPVLSVGT